jgi:A/G-specific adenine glycosylase
MWWYMDKKLITFVETIKTYYRQHKRVFAWRDVENSYYVFISEVMLQQTQTQRVVVKFEQFITAFPTINALAAASLADVLTVWQGLGYNRRAKFLHQAAQEIIRTHQGIIPHDLAALNALPGIGKATASSILAFAYNEPTVFIETNIRSVYIEFFFKDSTQVHDRDLEPLIRSTVDQENPRQWYYALMDYGVMLKKEHGNPSRKSKHHTTQSRFEGSDRQVRGSILRALILASLPRPVDVLREIVIHDIKREVGEVAFTTILEGLSAEEMVVIDAFGCVSLGGT